MIKLAKEGCGYNYNTGTSDCVHCLVLSEGGGGGGGAATDGLLHLVPSDKSKGNPTAVFSSCQYVSINLTQPPPTWIAQYHISLYLGWEIFHLVGQLTTSNLDRLKAPTTFHVPA